MNYSKNTKIILINAVGVKDVFAGIGHCVFHLFENVAKNSNDLQFKVYVADRMKDRYCFTTPNIEVIPVRLPRNSLVARILWDQLIVPILAYRAGLLISMMNAACVLSPISQITFIYDLADVEMPERFSKIKTHYLRLFRFFTMRRSKKILTISEATKRDLLTHYGNFEKLFQVIPLGFKKAQPNQETSTKEFLSLKLDKYFLFVSTIEPGKNIPRLICAFKKFQESHQDWKLVLVGAKGWGFQEVVSTISKEKIASHVMVLGYVSDTLLDTLYLNTDGFVFPSLYEGFGLPVLEAMQYFVPILTSNVSSLPEVGGAGVVYCDPMNIEEIAHGMERLLEKKKEDFKEAYLNQMTRYTWENGAKAVQKAIDAVLSE